MATLHPSSYRKSRRGAVLATSSVAILVVLFLALLLTGCSVQVGLDTRVETDGSGTSACAWRQTRNCRMHCPIVSDGLGGRVGGILGILGDLGGITGDIPQSADELFNLIIGQIPGDWTAERGTDSSGARWLTLTRSFSSPEELEEILSGGFLSSFVATDQFSLTQEQGLFSTKTIFRAICRSRLDNIARPVGSRHSRPDPWAGAHHRQPRHLARRDHRTTTPTK